MGLISVFLRSPVQPLTLAGSSRRSKDGSSNSHDGNKISHKVSERESYFNRRQSPPNSPRLLGLSNDALNVIGRRSP